MWIEKLISSGFKHTLSHKQGTKEERAFDYKHNWLGCSTYEPDQILVLGDYSCILSLQGLYTGIPSLDERINGVDKLFFEMKVRYIDIRFKGVSIWHTFSGEIPPNEIIDNMIK